MDETDTRADWTGTYSRVLGQVEWDDRLESSTDPKMITKPDSSVLPTIIVGEFDNHVYDIIEEAAAILITKHRDYGPRNISGSPGGPLNGLRVRMWDKVARINNLIDSGKTPEHESLRDSFLDLANYAVIACMVIDGKWPGVER